MVIVYIVGTTHAMIKRAAKLSGGKGPIMLHVITFIL